MFDLVVLVGFRCVWFVFHCVVGFAVCRCVCRFGVC